MEELHRIAKPNAKATFLVPYGSSDDAFEDPTHVRQYFLKSFGFFLNRFTGELTTDTGGIGQPKK